MNNPSIYRLGQQIYRRHPLGFPLTMLILACAGLVVAVHSLHSSSYVTAPAFLLIASAVVGLSGLLMFPFGFTYVLNRNLHPLVLTCPGCGIESRSLSKPFQQTQWNQLDYVIVDCSQCGHNFTVPANRKLI